MGCVISELYIAFRSIGMSEKAAESAAQALSPENLATRKDINRAVNAFRSAGVPEEAAKSAAEALLATYLTTRQNSTSSPP